MKTDQDINIDRMVKKSAIGWFVPAALCLICVAFVALGKVELGNVLSDYQTKEQAAKDKKEYGDKLDSYARQVADMQSTLTAMDKKLDHLQFALDFTQDRPARLSSPKTKDAGP
jgi:hypothetical protein